jgi:hypothetical protein
MANLSKTGKLMLMKRFEQKLLIFHLSQSRTFLALPFNPIPNSVLLANPKRGATIRGNQEKDLSWKRENVNFAPLGQKTRVRRESQ